MWPDLLARAQLGQAAGAALVIAGVGAGAGQAAPDEAFPGAVGYGRFATGWRGGEVVRVTNLSDEGPGSLRACAEAEFPRVCLFEVAGTIEVSRGIRVRSDVYIAGQTAPGQGVQLRLGKGVHTPLIVKNANDVVIRFIKSRPGAPVTETPAVDAVTLENVQRVYLDHLSLSFASDETLNIHASMGPTSDITVANSLLSFSLDRSTHPDGRHSKGALICSSDLASTGCGRITLWRNLFAHHRDRNPDVKATAMGPVEVVNNIFYNPISQFGEYYNLIGDTRIAHVGNVSMPGPSTIKATPPSVELFLLGEFPITLEARGNHAYADLPCESRVPGKVLGETALAHLSREPILSRGIPVAPADELRGLLTVGAGDVLPDGRHRDALDVRAVADILACTGAVIDRPEDAGGWPALAAAAPATDSDGDALPDTWEATHPALSPASPDDLWTPLPGEALGALETWLADLAGDV